MTSEKLTELRRLCEAATKVSKDWWVDHDDTHVGALQILDDRDWYWVSGDMSKPDDGYSGACSDEGYRGPKEVVQAHCRFVAAANPAAILDLLNQYEKAVGVIKYYRGGDDDDTSWMEPDQHLMYWTLWTDGDNVGGKRAREFLESLEGGNGK